MHVCCHTRVECRSLFDTADYWLRHDVVKWTRFVETTSVWWCHGCVAQPLEPLFTPWVLLEGGRNTKSLKWATYLTYLCFTMKIRSIKNDIFYFVTLSLLTKNMFLSPKLRLLAHKGPLGPLRTPFRGPLNSSKTKTFRNNNFFCFTLSDWAYLPKIMFLSPKLRLLALKGPLEPLRAP